MVNKGLSIEGVSSTLLETPTYAIALVLLFFLVLTLVFEHGVRALQQYLRRKGREGLSMAVEKVVVELTLLGFVSLILLLFQQYVPEICVQYNQSQYEWTLISNLKGNCPCCLAHTEGVTTCAQIYGKCAFSAEDREPFCPCAEGAEYSQKGPYHNQTACISYDENELIFNVFQVAKSLHMIAEQSGLTMEQILEIIIAEVRNSTSPPPPLPAPAEAPSPAAATDLATLIPGVGIEGGNRKLLNYLKSLYRQNPEYFDQILAEHNLQQFAARPFDSRSSRKLQQGEVLSDINDVNNTGLHIIPDVLAFRCEGPFYAGDCKNGTVPAISDEALHQAHLLLFITAAMHVACAIIVVLVAELRMLQWRKWEQEIIKDSPPTLDSILSADVGVAPLQLDPNDPTPNNSGATAIKDAEQQQVNGNQVEAAAVVEKPLENGDDKDTSTIQTQNTATTIEKDSSTDVKTALKSAVNSVRRQWHHRDTIIRRPQNRIREGFICIGQALLPNLVSKEEFITMRQAYVASLHLPTDYNFVQECTLHLDFDLVRILGSSVTMWVILILQWLLSGLVPWITSLFLLISYVTLFSINIGLVATIRYSCRGGRPHRVRTAKHWYKSPSLLSIPIGGIIFLCSTPFSNYLLFAWQFGVHSCFFVHGNERIWRWTPAGLPWWGALIAPAVMLLWLASVTVPAWAMIMHMRPHEDDAIAAQERMESGVADKEGVVTQASIMAEIARLEETLMNMQR